MGLVAICTPFFTKYTPPLLFWCFFFHNVTKLYEFRNNTCFLSVRLWNFTGHVITPFLAFGMLRKLTDCVTILPFDFRHVTEFRGLRNNASFWFPACLRTSRIVQPRVPSTSKRSNKGYMQSNNGPRTKLGYDILTLRIKLQNKVQNFKLAPQGQHLSFHMHSMKEVDSSEDKIWRHHIFDMQPHILRAHQKIYAKAFPNAAKLKAKIVHERIWCETS